MDMSASTEARSDQVNAADLVSGPRTYTIEKVTAGKATYPFDFHLIESPGKVYRPNLGMRRVLVAGWGPNTETYHGRRLTLFNEPSVIFAGAEIGGIRISAMSHLAEPLKTSIAINGKKKVPYIIQPLTDTPTAEPTPDLTKDIDEAIAGFQTVHGVTLDRLIARLGKARNRWTADDLAALRKAWEMIDAHEATPESAFPIQEPS